MKQVNVDHVAETPSPGKQSINLDTSAVASPRALSDEQIKQIREAILRSGGTLRLDGQGQPVEVDLVAGRTSADATAFDAVLACPNLKVIRVRAGQLPSTQLLKISSLRQLEELVFQDASINDDTVKLIIDGLPELRRVSLRGSHEVTDQGIAALAARPGLTHLALIDMHITGQAIERIAAMPALVALDLRMCQGITGNDLTPLSTAPKLKDLKLGSYGIDNASLSIVASFPHIVSLTIEDASIDAGGLAKLVEVRDTAGRLRALTFARCSGLTDEALLHLAPCSGVRQLALRDVPVTGSFLPKLPWVDHLETLSLNQTFLAEEAFATIATCRNLKRLELRGNLITPAAMEMIGTLSKLEHLDLAECALDDELLRPLAGLNKLRTLVIDGNPGVRRETVDKLLRRVRP